MPAKAHATGPGQLTFGDTAALKDFSCQVTAVKLTNDSDSDDDLPTLCGDVVPGEQTTTFTLEASFLQDYDKEGCIAWSWENMGTQVPFTFIPNSMHDMEFAGTVTVRAMEVGGDVKKKNVSEIEWPVVGIPLMSFPTSGV